MEEPEELTAEEKLQLESLIDPDEGVANEYKWDEEFQRHILGMLLNDRQFCVQSLGLIKPSYFTQEAHKIICSNLFKFFEKYKTIPTRVFITQEVEDVIKDKDQKVKWHYVSELNSVYDYYVPGVDARNYLIDKITNFAKIQSLKASFKKCLKEIREKPEDDATWGKVNRELREAMMVDRNFDPGLDYFQTFEERYAKMQEDIEVGEIFSSSFKDIDDALANGGCGRGEVYSFMGLSGTGKSLALVGAGVVNLTKGKKVLYVSLEMDEEGIAARFDAMISQVGIRDLIPNKEIVCESLREQVKDVEDPRLLVIKQFPPGTMDVNTLRAYIMQLAMYGFKPDMVLVDYIGEMKDYPNMPTWESRYRLVRDLRGFAVEENVCVFTAMQPNKSAREAQKSGVIDDDNLADAFGQIRPLDGCWSINQTQAEKEAGVARLFVVKHRSGRSRFQIHIEYNKDTLRMSQIAQEVYQHRMKVYQSEKKIRASDMTGDGVNNFNKKAQKFYDNQSLESDGDVSEDS